MNADTLKSIMDAGKARHLAAYPQAYGIPWDFLESELSAMTQCLMRWKKQRKAVTPDVFEFLAGNVPQWVNGRYNAAARFLRQAGYRCSRFSLTCLSSRERNELIDNHVLIYSQGKYWIEDRFVARYVDKCLGCGHTWGKDLLTAGCCHVCVKSYWMTQRFNVSAYLIRPEAVRALGDHYKALQRALEAEQQEKRRLRECQQQFKKLRKAVRNSDRQALQSLARELEPARISGT